MKGESVLLTILSRLQSVFSLIALLNSSISFLISRRRSKLALFGVAACRLSFLLWLSSSLYRLVPEQLSSCCSRSLISQFCLVSSSMLAMSVWICRVNVAESWGMLDSIWIYELKGTTLSNLSLKMSFPTDSAKLMMWKSSVKQVCLGESTTSSLMPAIVIRSPPQMATGVVPTTKSSMIKLAYRSFQKKYQFRRICISECVPRLVLRGVYIQLHCFQSLWPLLWFQCLFIMPLGPVMQVLISFQHFDSLSCNCSRY